MPRKSLLTPPELHALLGFPELDDRLLATHYTLTTEDIQWIRKRRGDSQRLGFALQLTVLSHLGRGLYPSEVPPLQVLAFLAEQLRVPMGSFVDYGSRPNTPFEHFQEITQMLGYRTFASRRKEMEEWLFPTAVATTRGFRVARVLVEELRHRKVLLPTEKVLEDMLAKVMTQADRFTHDLLIGSLKQSEADLGETLLSLREGTGRTQITWLKQTPKKPSTGNVGRLLERLQFLKDLPVSPEAGRLVHQNRLQQLAREGLKLDASHLRVLEEKRQKATLVAAVLDLWATLTDEVIEMHDRVMGSLFKEAERKQMHVYLDKGKPVTELYRLYRNVCQALLLARKAGGNLEDAVSRVVSWKELETTVEKTDQDIPTEQFDAMHHLKDGHSKLKSYASDLITTLKFQFSPALKPLELALQALLQMYRDNKRKLRKDAPVDFIKASWRPYVLPDGQTIDRAYYELCFFQELRQGLRSGDIWVYGSRKYRDFEEYLLPRSHFVDHPLRLLPDTDFDTYLAQHEEQLTLLLGEAAAALNDQKMDQVAVRGARFYVKPVKNETPAEAAPFSKSLYSDLPRVTITDLVLEVCTWKEVLSHFQHLRTGKPPQDTETLLTVILADALNLGITKMAEACPVPVKKLVWTSDWHLRDETYSSALSTLVNYHHQLPLSRFWGDGTTSSSDGQRFKTAQQGRQLGSVNLRYGSDPGTTFYTHLSDQYSAFHIKVIATTVRDATHVLDGLLYHESELEIKEHYTDTHGFTEHVFALMSLLGFKFAPRIRDLSDTRMYTLEKPSSYPTLQPFIARSLNVSLIRDHWDEILRLATSIRVGTVTASLMLGKLGSYPRQNNLALALRELGRLHRTLFTLEWLIDPELRKRVSRGLAKGEQKHNLNLAVSMYRHGEIRDRSAAAQGLHAQGLNFVTMCIIIWNTVYLQRTLEARKARLETIPEELLAHVSPMNWDHIGLSGDYVWNHGTLPAKGQFRPLRSEKVDLSSELEV